MMDSSTNDNSSDLTSSNSVYKNPTQNLFNQSTNPISSRVEKDCTPGAQKLRISLLLFIAFVMIFISALATAANFPGTQRKFAPSIWVSGFSHKWVSARWTGIGRSGQDPITLIG